MGYFELVLGPNPDLKLCEFLEFQDSTPFDIFDASILQLLQMLVQWVTYIPT